MARGMRGLMAGALVAILLPVLPSPGGMRRGERVSSGPSEAVTRAQVLEAYGRLPLRFEANRGQSDPRVKFLARGRGYNLFLTAQEAVLVWAGPPPQGRTREPLITATPWSRPGSRPAQVVRLRFVGGTPHPQATGQWTLPGDTSYFVGNDPARWRIHIPTYARVRYEALYPGVDLEYYGSQVALEYDLLVAARADPARIRLRVEGAEKLEVNAQGDLVLHLAGGEIRQRKPTMYQQVAGRRYLIAGGYVLVGPQEVGVLIGPYDASRPLIIDPVVLAYSTYLGGSGEDGGNGIAVDAAGNAYVTGSTGSANFPTTTGAFQAALGGVRNAFVTKLNATGMTLAYSTYLGGSGNDFGFGIAVDAAGNAYVTGSTNSANFPTTPGAFQTALGGGGDAFVTKLNATGTGLVYSTYLGGSSGDTGSGIAVDVAGNAYVTGYTFSANFPTTPGAFQTAFSGLIDAFVTKLNATGSALFYSTYLGGSSDDFGFGIAIDAAGNAYVTGQTNSANFPTTPGAFQTALAGVQNAFVTKLNATGSALFYSTYLGGSGPDVGFGIAADAAGNAYVTGDTFSTNFPTTAGAFQTALGGGADAFVTKLNATGTGLVYSTYLGGSGFDHGSGIAVDAAGNAYVTGQTASTNFPTTPGVFQTGYGGGLTDAFVTKLNATGTQLAYSAYLGGSDADAGNAITVDAAGNAYVTGTTSSANFPTRNPVQPSLAGSPNAFIARISPVVTVGLHNPATSTFFLRNSNTSGVADLTFAYGPAGAGWIPLVGHWTGPGTTTVGLYNPATGTFFLRTSNTGGIADLTFTYGPAGAGWIPLVGDWTGQGKVTVGLYDPLTSTFYLHNSNTGGVADLTFTYGPAGAGWIPIAGDWTGNGVDTVGLYNPFTSTFFLRNSNTSGIADLTFTYGPAGAGWIPLASDWTGQGRVTVGLYDPVTSTFYLRNSNSSGVADLTFGYGPAGASPPWRPVAGVWAGF